MDICGKWPGTRQLRWFRISRTRRPDPTGDGPKGPGAYELHATNFTTEARRSRRARRELAGSSPRNVVQLHQQFRLRHGSSLIDALCSSCFRGECFRKVNSEDVWALRVWRIPPWPSTNPICFRRRTTVESLELGPSSRRRRFRSTSGQRAQPEVESCFQAFRRSFRVFL
jgi:hypothetical protein